MTDREPGALARLERRGDAHYFGGHVMTENGSDDREAEFEIIGGVIRPVGGYVLDVSAYYKFSTGMRAGHDRDMFEYRADLTRSFGRAATRVRIDYSPDNGGKTDESYWVEGQGGWRVAPTTTLLASVGRRTVNSGRNFTAWNVGVNHRLTPNLAADVRWYDTSAHQLGHRHQGRMAFLLVVSF
ncbi:TorF family putative porin [Caulobacter sp. NIBR2454]|uniref:TorF family putative porin n=1 Tax=Caulobacter sp. NIBR2454 TaxID=3015996 RepID=UPI0022B723E4|nr:TorF family putative porin [Caulobacter sp. NIBR2454]